MEILNEIITFFYHLLFEKSLKNDFYFDLLIKNINYFIDIFEENFLIFIFFIISLIINIYLCLKRQNNYYYILFINVLIFSIIIKLFPLNIPFTDVYNELNYLFSDSSENYVFSKVGTENFFFSVFRLLHLIIYKFFNLNYYIIIILNFILYIFSLLLLINYLEAKNLKKYIFIFILIFFSGKWFIIFYEPVNIVWTINILLILLFINIKENSNLLIRAISLIFIYLLSFVNFKAGIVLLLYSIFYGIFLKEKVINKLLFIIAPLSIFILLNNTLFISDYSLGSQGMLLKYLTFDNIFSLLLNSLATHTLIFTTFIFPMKTISIIFVSAQYVTIIYFLFKDNKVLSNLQKFIVNNPLIILGILGCFLINFTREDYNQSRYMSFSMIFQIGFLLFLIKSNILNKVITIIRKKITVSIFVLIYLLNLFIPHQGILFALGKNYIYNNVMKCLNKNKNNNSCLPEMFYLTFYDINREHYKYFEKSIYILKKEKLSIFYEIK